MKAAIETRLNAELEHQVVDRTHTHRRQDRKYAAQGHDFARHLFTDAQIRKQQAGCRAPVDDVFRRKSA